MQNGALPEMDGIVCRSESSLLAVLLRSRKNMVLPCLFIAVSQAIFAKDIFCKTYVRTAKLSEI